MLVSVIIPVYNSNIVLLEDAIKSVKGQSYSKYEIILADDNSELSYQKKIDALGLRVIRLGENKGPGAARNAAIKVAEGSLLSFLDSDDLWHRDKLLHSVDAFKKDSELAMTCGNYQIMVNRRNILKPFYKIPPNINWNTLMRQNYVASGSVTVKADVFSKIGGFDERFRIAEDYAAWLKISENYTIQYIHQVLYYYSVIPGGSSITQNKEIQKNHIKILNLLKKESAERRGHYENNP